MINNNSTIFSIFKQFGKGIKKFIKLLQKTSKKNYLTFQRFQLSFIYFFALIVLVYTIINSLGYFPEFLFKFFPFLESLLNIKLLQILATPEKTFILYLIIIEILLNGSTFSFSILIKYNVLLIFVLEMLQNLIITYWDLLFTRELELFNGTTVVSKSATMIFFSFIFLLNFSIYFYCFFQSFKGNIPTFKGPFKILSDSVAFWLQIKSTKNK